MASTIVDRPIPPQRAGSELQHEIQRAARGVENDAMVRAIAGRMAAAARPRDRKLTKAYIRPLAFPVFVAGVACTCAVQAHFIIWPRRHESETHWFASIAAARATWPTAQLLDDAERVGRTRTAV
jgi:hypothetical protein